MTKDELLKIYAVYLPHKLEGRIIYNANDDESNEDCKLCISDGTNNECNINSWLNESYPIKPYLYPLDYLTKEQLIKAGFEDHIDWLTNEREGWIKKYGLKNYLDKTPYGHIQYLISEHFNIFGLPEDQFINKATIKYGK